MRLRLGITCKDQRGGHVHLRRTVNRPYPGVPTVGDRVYPTEQTEWSEMTVERVVYRNDGTVSLSLHLDDDDPLVREPDIVRGWGFVDV